MKIIKICKILLIVYLISTIYFSENKREMNEIVEIEECKTVKGVENISDFDTTDRVCVWELYTITAYCGCEKCCGKSDGITASGTIATEGRTIATDIKEIPYGTEVEIDGVGVFIAEDCGGAIKGNRIDIFFNSHQKAMEFGRQERFVLIKKEEK